MNTTASKAPRRNSKEKRSIWPSGVQLASQSEFDWDLEAQNSAGKIDVTGSSDTWEGVHGECSASTAAAVARLLRVLDLASAVGVRTALLMTLVISLIGIIPGQASAQLNPGDILVLDRDVPALFRITPSGNRTVLSDFRNCDQGQPIEDPVGIALDASGNILVVDERLGILFRITPSGQCSILSDFHDSDQGRQPIGTSPFGVAVEASGQILVIDPDATSGAGALFRVDPVTRNRTLLSDFGNGSQGPIGGDPLDVATEVSGFILVVDRGRRTLFRVDPGPGPTMGHRTIVSDFGGQAFDPINLAVEASGDILVSDVNLSATPRPSGTRVGALFRVDPATGASTILSDFGDSAQGRDPLGDSPAGVAVEASGDILVVDHEAGTAGKGALFRIDPLTGHRTILIDFGNGPPELQGESPVGVAVFSNVPQTWDLISWFTPNAPSWFDANGFLLNPRWQWQRPGSVVPEFNRFNSTQPITSDLQSGPTVTTFTCDGGIRGHFNWFDNLLDVTLEGLVFWRDHSSGDDDYNLQIVTPSVSPQAPTFNGEELRAGVTPGTRTLPDRATVPPELRGLRAIKGEFDSDETIDQEVFDQIPFWKDFHTAVDTSDELAGRLIDGHPAIMMGLMGIDDEHENSSEIHPVHMLAIQMDKTRNPTDDAWAIFVRNWGNEGYCSSRQHFLNREAVVLQLRRPSGLPLTARAVTLPSTKFKGQNLGNAPRQFDVHSQAGNDAFVVFHLPLPEGCTNGLFGSECALIAGELHLAWMDAATGMPQARLVASESATRTTQAVSSGHKESGLESDEEKDAEDVLNDIIGKMTDQQRADYQAILNDLIPPPTPRTIEELVPVLLNAPPPQAPLDMPPMAISSAPAIRGVQRNDAVVRAICRSAPDIAMSAGADCSVFSAQKANLSVTTADSPTSVTVGDHLTYTFTITNSGPNDATGVTLNDILPAEVTLVLAPEGCSGTEVNVTCNLGALARGNSTTIQLVVTATEIGDITNAAIVGSREIDDDLTNNAATQGTTINPPVKIDIKPGEFPNIITVSNDPNRIEVIPVAILTTAIIDATTVDPSTVRFGKTGTEAAPVQVARADADGDGTLDLVLRFRTQDTGLQCGDTSALLTGKTMNGRAIQGSDSIVTVRGGVICK